MVKKLILTVIIVLSLGLMINMNFNVTEMLSRYGSRGSEVTQIQTRLKQWGYYTGAIDGIYGSSTVAAVKRFQSKYGLTPDGIAGPATLSKMGITSTSSTASNNDVNLLARLINGEARGEPYEGQVAIGGVVMNRVRDSRFPKTIAGVIYQPGSFTAVSDGQINLPVNATCLKAASQAINGWDPSGGAIYYFNPATATNRWIWSRPQIKVIGRHIFCK